MKKINVIAVILMAILTTASTCTDSDENKQSKGVFKILTYNIKNCIGMDGVVNYQRVADVIKRVNADVVAIQELDSATRRSKGVVVLDELARMTGMHSIYGSSIEYQGGRYGIGILTREKTAGWQRIPLPGREEARSLLIADMGSYVLACTHLSLTEEDRLASVEIINSSLLNYNKPVFLAGDLNAVPESSVIKRLQLNWTILNDFSVSTIPSAKPTRCIDYILGLNSRGWTFTTIKTVVEDEPVVSDHRPVWAEVEVRREYH